MLGGGAFFALTADRATAPAPAAPPAGDTAPAASRPSRRTLNVTGSNQIAPALIAAGIAPAQAAAAARDALAALGQVADEIRLSFDLQGAEGQAALLALEATKSDGSGIVLKPTANGTFAAERLAADLKTRIDVVRGEIDAQSFYTSAVAAGVTDSLISDFAAAFSFDFDMQREVAPGDVFEAAFEQAYNPSGQPVGVPRLVYASLRTAAKSRTLYRFTPPGKVAGWFDGNGHSIVRSLMRTPVDGARVSSTFGMRVHPVLGFQKLHKGVDFAAPIGTPIYASGNAVVELATPSATAGNWARLRHDNGWETVYMHMNRYMPGIAAGARVTQGQQIGEVGTTGRSTGPHLHYEVRVGGEPVDPQGIDTGTGETLSGAVLAAFVKERDRIDARRADAPS